MSPPHEAQNQICLGGTACRRRYLVYAEKLFRNYLSRRPSCECMPHAWMDSEGKLPADLHGRAASLGYKTSQDRHANPPPKTKQKNWYISCSIFSHDRLSNCGAVVLGNLQNNVERGILRTAGSTSHTSSSSDYQLTHHRCHGS